MKPRAMLVVLVVSNVAVAFGCRGSMTPTPQASAPAAAAATAGAGVAAGAISPTQRFNDSVMQAQLALLGARQSDSAAAVFVNLQIPWLRGTSARTFLTIMNGGYARALGVTCEHCHVTSDFASDAKRPKLAAREM